MSAYLCALGVDLEWADNQYWTTLVQLIREATEIRTPKKKEKISASQMQKFIKD